MNMNAPSWNSPDKLPPMGQRVIVIVLLKDAFLSKDPSGYYEDGPCIWNGKAWIYCASPFKVQITRQMMGWREEACQNR